MRYVTWPIGRATPPRETAGLAKFNQRRSGQAGPQRRSRARRPGMTNGSDSDPDQRSGPRMEMLLAVRGRDDLRGTAPGLGRGSARNRRPRWSAAALEPPTWADPGGVPGDQGRLERTTAYNKSHLPALRAIALLSDLGGLRPTVDSSITAGAVRGPPRSGSRDTNRTHDRAWSIVAKERPTLGQHWHVGVIVYLALSLTRRLAWTGGFLPRTWDQCSHRPGPRFVVLPQQ